MSKKISTMFKVKFLSALALLAVVVQDEVKCTGMVELVANLIELSSDLIRSNGPSNKPVLPIEPSAKPIKAKAYSSTDEKINGPICGTRSNNLSHSVLNTHRIVGGSYAKPGDWPWQVGISPRNGGIFCGATLVTNEWLVGAAHCFSKSGSSHLVARLGDHDQETNEGTEQYVPVKQVIHHPKYIGGNHHSYDIALIQLSRKIAFTKYIRPACIPGNWLQRPGVPAYVSGWGYTSENGISSRYLKVAQVPIVSHWTCKSTYPSLDTTMICAGNAAGGVDSCQGDSGGPLVIEDRGRFYLTGVVSYGYGCGRPNIPGVYARVSSLRRFIYNGILYKPPTSLNCNFEKYICQWTQSKRDNFDWERKNGSTPSIWTGPSQSSTGSEGYYLYIEASDPRRKGDRAILKSPEIYSDSAACLRFKAHMYSYLKDRMGTLEILMKEKWSKNTRIFTKGGDQGNQWLSYNVDLPKGGPYKLEITATRETWMSDIAIDDLFVTLKPCVSKR